MKKLKEKKNNSGEVMLEAVLIIPITLFAILLVLAWGFLIYERAQVNILAAETAEYVAAGFKYGYTADEIDYSTLDDDFKFNRIPLWRTGINRKKMEKKYQEKAEEFVNSKINVFRIGDKNQIQPDVKTDIIVDGAGRMHVEVHISYDADTLFREILLFQTTLTNSDLKFEGVGRAEIFDITGYASDVKLAYYGASKVDEMTEKLNKLQNAVSGLANLVIDSLKELSTTE